MQIQTSCLHPHVVLFLLKCAVVQSMLEERGHCRYIKSDVNTSIKIQVLYNETLSTRDTSFWNKLAF